ncbi:hypothetical protein [Micromonospora sp. NBC_00860]|uniref:hypothetical protein n=1 Tax=Micromonospora sp. NBC_00860 TaxID=2975980 RepID=UPI00386AD449|nr:hypothetical protein OH804_03585 [Micromonospora sp. NBC_00860]
MHGAPLPPDAPDPRDWLLYRGYGALLAASGVVTALVSYQVSELSAMPARFLPVEALSAGTGVPLVLTRAGQDIPPVLAGIDAFLPAATAQDWPMRVIEVPDGQHSFDILNPGPQSEAAVLAARDAVLELLATT